MALLVHDGPDTARRLTPAGQRVLVGMLLVLCAAAGWSLWRHVVMPDPKVVQALWGGLFAAAATALGTLPVVLQQRISERTRDAMLGFGAGVMLAACAFSLVVPGIEAARTQGAGPWGAAAIVAAGILLGALLLVALDHWLPHEHFIKGIEGSREHARALRRTWLFVFAIALHNLPEGLAIGVAFGGADPLAASALATGIAIQDVPEGLVIALALRGAGYGRGLAVALGAASGLVEPMGAVVGAGVMGLSAGLLPWGLAFAAGAMLFVISHEMIPESHRQGHERYATAGLMLGFVLMMMLDTALG
jgi:ZIP family zinc transporter